MTENKQYQAFETEKVKEVFCTWDTAYKVKNDFSSMCTWTRHNNGTIELIRIKKARSAFTRWCIQMRRLPEYAKQLLRKGCSIKAMPQELFGKKREGDCKTLDLTTVFM